MTPNQPTWSVHLLPCEWGSGGHFGTFLSEDEAKHLKTKLEARDAERKFVIRRGYLGAAMDVTHLMEDFDG